MVLRKKNIISEKEKSISLSLSLSLFKPLSSLALLSMGNTESSVQDSAQQQQESIATLSGSSSFIRAKPLFSKGHVEGAFAVLREAALEGNVVACLDAGFMMMQGIGCEKDWKGGWELLKKGSSLVGDSKDDCWKRDQSVSVFFEPQSMDFNSLFSCGFVMSLMKMWMKILIHEC